MEENPIRKFWAADGRMDGAYLNDTPGGTEIKRERESVFFLQRFHDTFLHGWMAGGRCYGAVSSFLVHIFSSFGVPL